MVKQELINYHEEERSIDEIVADYCSFHDIKPEEIVEKAKELI